MVATPTGRIAGKHGSYTVVFTRWRWRSCVSSSNTRFTWVTPRDGSLLSNGISIGSAVFAQLTRVTNTQTDRQTDRHTDHATYRNSLHLALLAVLTMRDNCNRPMLIIIVHYQWHPQTKWLKQWILHQEQYKFYFETSSPPYTLYTPLWNHPRHKTRMGDFIVPPKLSFRLGFTPNFGLKVA